MNILLFQENQIYNLINYYYQELMVQNHNHIYL